MHRQHEVSGDRIMGMEGKGERRTENGKLKTEICVLLCFAHDEAVDVASQEIARCYCQPEGKNLRQMGKGKVCGNTQIEKGVCYTVRESTVYEDGDAEQHGQVLALASKGHHGGHDEAATYCQYAAFHGAQSQTGLQNALGGLLQWHGRASEYQGHGGATHKIAEENQHNLGELSFLEESCRTCVEFKAVPHYGQESEREEHRSYYVLLCKIAETGNAYADAGNECRAQREPDFLYCHCFCAFACVAAQTIR